MLDEIEQRVVDDIARFGFHMIRVNADEHGPTFVYSIGLMHTQNHPEVIMFGLDGRLMARILTGIYAEIGKGRPFKEQGLYDGLLEGFACKIIPVLRAHHEAYLGYAMWHRRHLGKISTLEAVQFIWPDKQGLFPDDPHCHEHVVGLQPLLDRL